MNSAYVGSLTLAFQAAAILAHHGLPPTINAPLLAWMICMGCSGLLAIIGDFTSSAAREARS